MTIRNLDKLLLPGSVAVIGASSREGSVGARVWRNLTEGEGAFEGPVYAVNPAHDRVGDRPCYPNAAALPGPVDLAVVCTPPSSVPAVIAELGAAGARAAIVTTAGLSAEQRQAMLNAARPHVLRLLGPNCLGLMTPRQKLSAGFAHVNALPGDIAFVSQSGALVTAMLDWARSRGIGFSHLVSLGEHADVDFGDLLDHLATDASTRAILLYIESVDSARKFMSAARAAARNKPVIVVKAGRSARGMQAAASHTGALAGSDMVYDAAIRRAGMLRVDTLQDLFLAAQTLSRMRDNRGERLAVMTNGGGAGVMAADEAERLGVELYEPGADTLARLDAALPATWSHGNPIDIIGDAPGARYVDTLHALLDDPSAGAVLFVHAPTAIVPSRDIAQACAPLLASAPHRVMACWLGDGSVVEARRIFQAAGIADYETPEEAVKAFSMLVTYRRNQLQLMEVPEHTPLVDDPDVTAARSVVDAAIAEGREMLGEPEAKRVLEAFRIPVARSIQIGPDPDAAAAAAAGLGFPVALKIVSGQITHKSDAGGVALSLGSEAEVKQAAAAMLDRLRRERPRAVLEGFSVQPMIVRPHARELIVGASVDSVFGPVLLFGQGGVAVEVIADRALALPPLNSTLARELISRTRVARQLEAFRDRPAVRIEAVVDVLVAVSRLMAELGEVIELDINPLLADERGAIALDARIRVRGSASDRSVTATSADRFAIRPYPAHLAEEIDWRGARVVLRPIRPEDDDQHIAFMEQLAPEDVRMRVFYTRRTLPRSEMARLTQIDYAREMAFIAEHTKPDGSRETLGTARAMADPDNVEAEFAVIVRSDLKGQGLGKLLLDKLVRYQREAGTQRLVGVVLRENEAMLGLARHLGFSPQERHTSDFDVIHLQMDLQSASAGDQPAAGS